jgi:hypothetical protein
MSRLKKLVGTSHQPISCGNSEDWWKQDIGDVIFNFKRQAASKFVIVNNDGKYIHKVIHWIELSWKETERLHHDVVQVFERLALAHAANQRGWLPGCESDGVQALFVDNKHMTV